jgi:hypothetical protein
MLLTMNHQDDDVFFLSNVQMSYSSFENTRSEADFQKLAQTIATSIQKILQNGKYIKINIINLLFVYYKQKKKDVYVFAKTFAFLQIR